MLTWLLPLEAVAWMTTLPPGPGAATSRRASNCPVFATLIATPEVLPLFNVIEPPEELRRPGVS
jgi:hypothetical protein